MIEVVRGGLDRARADALLSFWAARRALPEAEARRRLSEVVCVVRADGALVGACSVYPAELPLVGHRRFWVYRSLLDPIAVGCGPAMVRTTFATLEEEFAGAHGSPIGLCVLVADADERRRRPEAVWRDPPLVYAGYLDDGRQVRIGYFRGAEITRGDEAAP